MSSCGVTRRFQIALIKPPHYDDGYVIQWARAFILSNALATLGDDYEIDVNAAEEINTTRIRPTRIIERFRRHDNFGLVFLVGMRSNQFPRVLDIGRPLRAARVPMDGASIRARSPRRCASTSGTSSCGG